MKLPLTRQEITPQWLTDALACRIPGVETSRSAILCCRNPTSRLLS